MRRHGLWTEGKCHNVQFSAWGEHVLKSCSTVPIMMVMVMVINKDEAHLSLFWQDCQSRRSEMWRRPLFVSILHFSTSSPSSAPASTASSSTASSSPLWSSTACQSRRSENCRRPLCWSDFVSTLQFSNSIEIETEQQLCLQLFSSLTIENVTHKPPTNIISDWFGHLMLKCHKQNPKRFMQKWHPPQSASKKVVTRNLKYDLSLYCW